MSNFKAAYEKLALPVTVVTVGRGGVENALTVSWMTPVAFEPPHVAIGVDRLHHSVEFLRSTKSFVINVLGDGQKNLAGHFAKQSFTDQDKLDAVNTREGQTGAAIIEDAVAFFDCEVAGIHEVGDHLLVIGKVVDADALDDTQRPLSTSDGLHYRK